MPSLIAAPSLITAAGQPPKKIEEFIARVNSETDAVITHKGEWIRYSTPQGAEYIAVCLPAFSPATVHRDASTSADA